MSQEESQLKTDFILFIQNIFATLKPGGLIARCLLGICRLHRYHYYESGCGENQCLQSKKLSMEILEGIKNIIFDLGGVVINIDYKRTLREFAALGLDDIEKVYSQNKQLPWFDQYDKGGISSEAFVSGLSKLLNPGVSREQIIRAWNAMLLDFPPERAELLIRLRKKYQTFLLSNTNEIHIDYYLGRIREWYGKDAMDLFFKKAYYSNRIGMRKPDRETFEFVIRENGLSASETLFIDDTLQHVEGARLAGLRAYHLQAPETIMNILV